MYSWGVFFDEYNRNVYPGEQTKLTWIGGFYFFMGKITGPFYVWMLSKVSDRKMLTVSAILCPVALMLASITNEVCYKILL